MENKVWFARRPRHWVLLYSQTFRENDDPMIGFPTDPPAAAPTQLRALQSMQPTDSPYRAQQPDVTLISRASSRVQRSHVVDQGVRRRVECSASM